MPCSSSRRVRFELRLILEFKCHLYSSPFCQDWLLISFSPHSSVVGKQKKLGSSRLPRQVELTVVVGRGIHSAGPPRLAPAIKKHFREKGINFRLEDDGAVIKCFQELS